MGGLLPLVPYFLIHQVGDNLLWSFVVCLPTLFVLNFSRDPHPDTSRPRGPWWRQALQRRRLCPGVSGKKRDWPVDADNTTLTCSLARAPVL